MLIGLAVAAYVLSSVSVFLREVLEGKHFRPLLLKGLFEKPQRQKRDRLIVQCERAREEAATISDTRPKWQQTLRNASGEGVNNHAGVMTYDGKAGAAVEAASINTNP